MRLQLDRRTAFYFRKTYVRKYHYIKVRARFPYPISAYEVRGKKYVRLFFFILDFILDRAMCVTETCPSLFAHMCKGVNISCVEKKRRKNIFRQQIPELTQL